ncbi:DUF1269 domain-containing protein [Undibacterium sp. B2R-29]|nr:DUF1269 domain-containing protein [Undibacterium crateris]
MHIQEAAIYVFGTRADAEVAIGKLSVAGIDVTKLSLIGKGYHSEEHPIGFYTMGDKIKSWGAKGAFWGGIWGLLIAPAVFVFPGVGLVAMAGPIVAMIASALEGAVIVGGLSALGAAMTVIGVPKEKQIMYETALKADQYILIAHGTEQDVARVKAELANIRIVSDYLQI